MFEIFLREWIYRRGRMLLTLCSVAIASATLLGVLLASSSARRAYQDMNAALEGAPTLEIVNQEGGRFSADIVPDLRGVAGVKRVVPMLFRASLIRMRELRAKVIVGGVDEKRLLSEPPRFHEGSVPEVGEAILARPLAEALRVKVGDEVLMLVRRGVRKVKISGTATREELEKVAPGSGVVMRLEDAQQLFGLGGQIDRARIELTDDANREQTRDAIAVKLPPSLAIQLPQGRVRLAEELMRSAEMALSFACALAAAIAGFVVLNTVRMNLSERRRQISILRCVGATARQVERSILQESLVVGVLGTCIGIPAGILIGRGLASVLAGIVRTEIHAVTPSLATIVAVSAGGPLVTLLAAYFPARQTRAISPLEGLRDAEPPGYDRFPWASVLSGATVWIIATLTMVAVVEKWIVPQAAIPAGVLMLLSFVLWLPALLKPMLRGLTWLLRGRWEIFGQLSGEQLLRRRTRTGLTAGVIVVALTSSVGLGHAISNNVEDIRTWYRRYMSGDYFLQPSSSSLTSSPGIEDPVYDELKETPGVKTVDRIRLLSGRAREQPVTCIVRDFPTNAPLPLQLVGTTEEKVRAELAEGKVVVGTVLAQRLRLRPGHELLVELSGRSHQFRVAALASDYWMGGMVLFLELPAARKRFDPGIPDFYSVTADTPAPPDIAKRLRELAEKHGAVFTPFAVMREVTDRRMNGVIGALWAVVVLIFLASGLGIANTMTMSVSEQTRELGLMRIVGMTPRQSRRLVFVEASFLGAMATIMGLIAGVSTAYIMHRCNEPVLGHVPIFRWHMELLVGSVVGTMVLVIVGAWGPGRQASRLDVLEAIAEE